MSQRKRRYYQNDEEENRFETEAFSHLNDDETEDSKPEHDQEWGSEDSDPEDVQEKPETDSDDEAPDDVGFHDSRQSVLSQLRSAMRQVDAEKQKKKSKRKQLDTQFKEQKAKKQEDLEKTKLPEDFLESIDDVIPKKIQKTEGKRYEDGKKRRNRKPKTEATLEMDSAIVQKSDDRLSANFIAFTDSASGVQVADLKYLEKQSKTVAQLAAEFRHSKLYGKNVKRESNQKRLAKKEKRRHRVR
ncbi:nucleolin-like [Mercenaria mercenaria]|uniref:nucleolin-like n=1 Tax=Mercenaria mercenaria TaxID=6596 RepID=UPI00234F2DBF|nr:nucleolin-like [Mercenaria mercenaria]